MLIDSPKMFDFNWMGVRELEAPNCHLKWREGWSRGQAVPALRIRRARSRYVVWKHMLCRVKKCLTTVGGGTSQSDTVIPLLAAKEGECHGHSFSDRKGL